MPAQDPARLEAIGIRAKEAEARDDDASANEEWRRYRLAADAARNPDELLADGVALSTWAAELASQR